MDNASNYLVVGYVIQKRSKNIFGLLCCWYYTVLCAQRPLSMSSEKQLRIRIPSTPLHLSKTCLNDKILASDNNTEQAPDRTRVVSRNLFGQKPDSHLSSLHDCSSSGLKRLNPKEMFWSKSCSIIM